MILETKRLRLRPLSLGDSERIEELAGEYDVAKTTSTIPHPYP
ncbi:acetyltransferase, partial [Bacillus sp. LL01]